MVDPIKGVFEQVVGSEIGRSDEGGAAACRMVCCQLGGGDHAPASPRRPEGEGFVGHGWRTVVETDRL